MSVSQNLLAFFGGGSAQVTAPVTAANAGASPDTEGLTSFAELLVQQQPEEVKALMQLLGQEQTDAAQSLMNLADIAADGKNLPTGMQEWLAQLEDLRSETEDQAALLQAGETSVEQQEELGTLVDEWSHWLEQARLFMGDAPQSTSTTQETVDPEAAEALAAMASLLDSPLASQAPSAPAAATPTPVATAVGPELAARAGDASKDGKTLLDPARNLKQEAGAGAGALQSTQDPASRSERESRQEPAGNNIMRAVAERSTGAEGQQPVQRNLDPTTAGSEGRAAFAGKLAETLEALGGRSASPDKDAGEAPRPGAQAQAAVQGALAARPVLAASQALNVPFGQAGWGDAIMDKMMWMSSQNLRSVEIRLDPADLGPLEIHIQTRGQEHQVQFVTQNPSVREALEAQMFRLREAFSQQGMDLVNVTVGDSAAEQQAHHNQEGSSQRGGRGVAGVSGSAGDEAGVMIAAAAASQAESSRLIDYYA
jgi:flagellar hook-length control protein FliK